MRTFRKTHPPVPYPYKKNERPLIFFGSNLALISTLLVTRLARVASFFSGLQATAWLCAWDLHIPLGSEFLWLQLGSGNQIPRNTLGSYYCLLLVLGTAWLCAWVRHIPLGSEYLWRQLGSGNQRVFDLHGSSKSQPWLSLIVLLLIITIWCIIPYNLIILNDGANDFPAALSQVQLADSCQSPERPNYSEDKTALTIGTSKSISSRGTVMP